MLHQIDPIGAEATIHHDTPLDHGIRGNYYAAFIILSVIEEDVSSEEIRTFPLNVALRTLLWKEIMQIAIQSQTSSKPPDLPKTVST